MNSIFIRNKEKKQRSLIFGLRKWVSNLETVLYLIKSLEGKQLTNLFYNFLKG